MNRTQRTKKPRGKSPVVQNYQRLVGLRKNAQANLRYAEKEMEERRKERQFMDTKESDANGAQKGAATKALNAAYELVETRQVKEKLASQAVEKYNNSLNRKAQKKIRLHA